MNEFEGSRRERGRRSSTEGLGASLGRRRRQSSPAPTVLIALGVLLLVVVGVFWWRSRAEPDPDPTVAGEPTAGPVAGAPGDDFEPIDLPPLSASDELVRQMIARLSAHPQLAAWLANDELVQRFVGSVVTLAAGSRPLEHIGFMNPGGQFRVQSTQGRLVIDPASYTRYDLPTAVLVSLDTPGSVRLYRQLHPLFEEAHQDLGFEEGTFDATFARAIDNLLVVRVPPGPIEVVQDEAFYVFRDPSLEAGTGAQRQLLRMGPDNARRVQAKLEELRGALGLEEVGGI